MSDLLPRTLGEQIEIETVLGGGLWQTLADPNQLENALLNLAVNARDAMPDGGKLTIETGNAHLDELYAAGQHRGAGRPVCADRRQRHRQRHVAARSLAQAFEPFFTTKEAGHGTGLGLSQVYGFVKQSGGHVKMYSEPGQGTTVKIYLPRLLTAQERRSRSRCQQTRAAAGRRDGDGAGGRGRRRCARYSTELVRDLGYRVLEAVEWRCGACELLER